MVPSSYVEVCRGLWLIANGFLCHGVVDGVFWLESRGLVLMKRKKLIIGIITQTKVRPAESGLPSRLAADVPDISGASGTAGGTARRRPISGRRSLFFGL
jgi:hypothetical protein